MSTDDFKYFSQEFDGKVLDLVTQKETVLMSIWVVFKSLEKNCQAKTSFIVLWQVKMLLIKNMKVWDKSEMKTIKNYHFLYLKCEVSLLADVFEKFRNNSLKNYGLSRSHYLSAPALSWYAMLNMLKVSLELISDADMYLFFVSEAEFLTFLRDILKPAISIWNLTTQNKNQNIFYT